MSTAAPRALILSGAGRYADPWHPFDQTSARIAAVLGAEGFDVEVATDVDSRMAELGDSDGHVVPDLVVVNIGEPGTPDAQAEARGRAGLLDYLASGGPLLVMHVSSTSLDGVPEWEQIVGGIWVRGTTMHPDFGLARIHVYPERHPIVAGIQDFSVLDEEYTYLRTDPKLVPLATHRHDGDEHPLIWAREYGRSRVVYDALGHDERSYDSPEHRLIIARAARWLIGALA